MYKYQAQNLDGKQHQVFVNCLAAPSSTGCVFSNSGYLTAAFSIGHVLLQRHLPIFHQLSLLRTPHQAIIAAIDPAAVCLQHSLRC